MWEAEGRSEGRRLEYRSGVEREIATREGLSDDSERLARSLVILA
jgi:hypothetical protein